MGISVEAKSGPPLRRRPSKGGEEGNRESIGRWQSREAYVGRGLFTAGSPKLLIALFTDLLENRMQESGPVR